MNDELIQLFIDSIATETGLQIRPQDRSALGQKISTRMKILKLTEPKKYYQLLVAKNQQSQSEWREFALLLTVTESYFMRDKGQLSLLEKVILPQLIETKRKLSQELGIQPALRIWSAGCSTGEEPYSLAIILKQLISDWERWEILILGTDINQAALAKAQRGIYSPWSFRLVDPQLQNQYFKRHQVEWEINPKIRKLVNFGCVNLVTDNFPNIGKDIYNMDLIVCRNVFVYFEAKYISQVLKKFAKTLRPGGYLMTGHAEIHGQIIKEFQPQVFPESVVYQARDAVQEVGCQIELRMAAIGKKKLVFGELGKRAAVGVENSQLLAGGKMLGSFTTQCFFPEMMPVLTPGSPLEKMLRVRYLDGDFVNKAVSVSRKIIAEKKTQQQPEMLVYEAKRCFKNKVYAEAIDKAQQAIDQQVDRFEAYYLLAQIHANLGHYDRAIEYCKHASQVDPVSVFPYYLQAHIAEEQGELETAKILLKRTIYLCPSFVSAYLELGNIYNKEGKVTRAIKMYDSSCEILKKLPPNTPIEQQEKMTASQVLMNVKKDLVKLYSK